MQRFFHDELRQLRDDLILMGERSLDMSRLVLRAVETGDDSLALQVRGMDDRVDELEKRVDREIMRYLTLFGPMGSDVRLLLAARDIGHDLERIADEASVIAKRAMVISERGPLKNLCTFRPKASSPAKSCASRSIASLKATSPRPAWS